MLEESEKEIEKKKKVVKVEEKISRGKKLCEFLIKPENLDHMFFLFMSIGFIIFCTYYWLIYYALYEKTQ
jgi:hypothetical protein